MLQIRKNEEGIKYVVISRLILLKNLKGLVTSELD